MLPNFIGIGAQRAATTWLYQCLKEHPEVYVPDVKEIHFFDENYDKPLAWYLSFFENAGGYRAVGVITPMLGLLGTVTGMIRAFQNIAMSGTGNPNLMATGIAEALTTTAAGLIVAIPSLAAYHFIRGRVDRLVYEMEEIATTLLASLPIKNLKPATKEIKDEISQTAGGGVSSGINASG